MLSTMTPTIVLGEDRKVLLVTGTPGGGRIINVILQVIVNVIDYEMNIAEATHQPRIHQGWRKQELGVETGMNPESIKLLKSMGHKIDLLDVFGNTKDNSRLSCQLRLLPAHDGLRLTIAEED